MIIVGAFFLAAALAKDRDHTPFDDVTATYQLLGKSKQDIVKQFGDPDRADQVKQGGFNTGIKWTPGWVVYTYARTTEMGSEIIHQGVGEPLHTPLDSIRFVIDKKQNKVQQVCVSFKKSETAPFYLSSLMIDEKKIFPAEPVAFTYRANSDRDPVYWSRTLWQFDKSVFAYVYDSAIFPWMQLTDDHDAIPIRFSKKFNTNSDQFERSVELKKDFQYGQWNTVDEIDFILSQKPYIPDDNMVGIDAYQLKPNSKSEGVSEYSVIGATTIKLHDLLKAGDEAK